MLSHDVVASLAVTLDGYIARRDGSVDYLDKYQIEGFDFDEFTSTIGALLMGSTTYEQAVGWGWLWHRLPTMVLTTRSGLPVPEGADVRFTAMPTAEAIRSFSVDTPKRLWVMGGGGVITRGLAAGVIDTLDLMVIPEAIGNGIPLFTQSYQAPGRLVDATAFRDGAVRLVYDTRPPEAGR